jgi:hypothetical protein
MMMPSKPLEKAWINTKLKKEEIKIQAEALECKRNDAQRHGPPFGFAVIFSK